MPIPTLTIVGLVLSGIWTLIDLFLIPGNVRAEKETMRQRLTLDYMGAGHAPPRTAAPQIGSMPTAAKPG